MASHEIDMFACLFVTCVVGFDVLHSHRRGQPSGNGAFATALELSSIHKSLHRFLGLGLSQAHGFFFADEHEIVGKELCRFSARVFWTRSLLMFLTPKTASDLFSGPP